ncbi:MAG TPA: S16 family serine protease, partial [Isosphaeraceae bacterium]
GGVREKVLAARRAGIKAVVIPRHNEKDLIELPAEVKADLTFHLVDTLDDVVPLLFPPRPRPATRRARARVADPPTLATPQPETAPSKPSRRPRPS